jgi:DNA-binding LacI/PurR family transcriptional regulator
MRVKQIAKQAGVSAATVYRVIANSPGISSETVTRVQAVMREMGIHSPRAVYQRSPRRKASTGITSGQVAFVLVGAGPDASLALIRGLEASLNPQSVRLTFAQVSHPDELLGLAQDRKLDGMVLHGWMYPPPSPGCDAQLRRLALVWAMTHQEDWGDCVQPDNSLLGRAAAEQLLGQGVKELAAVIPEPGHLAFESRAQAFCRVGTQRGLPTQILRWEQGPRRAGIEPTRDVLPDLIARLKLSTGGPLGLLVPEDTYVGAVYNLLWARKLTVGRDVCVGVCGTHPDQVMGLAPAPTRVDIDLEEVGRQTAALLLWRLAHRDSPTRVITLVKPRNA